MYAKLLLAILPFTLASPVEPEPLKIGLEARTTFTNEDGFIDLEKLLASVNQTLVKYKATPLAARDTQLEERANVPLSDISQGGEDEAYQGPGTVGSQRFRFDFDTGSSDIFVPGPTCGAAQGCTGSTKYRNTGADQHRMTTALFGSGEIRGEDYKDKVTVGGLTVPHQGFISLTEAQGFSNSGFDGLFGMAFTNIAQTRFTTFFENLINQKKVSVPEFSFYLGRALSGTGGKSELTLGGRDASKFSGAVTRVPVTRRGYWQVALGNVKVNGASAGGATAGQAAIDTGTTIVLAPKSAARAIFSKIPGAAPAPGLSGSSSVLLYTFPCGLDPKYVPAITFAGRSFKINPLDFNLGRLSQSQTLQVGPLGSIPLVGGTDDARCVAGIAGSNVIPGEKLYIVGDVFLKNWYSIYSYNGPAVNFAKAV